MEDASGHGVRRDLSHRHALDRDVPDRGVELAVGRLRRLLSQKLDLDRVAHRQRRRDGNGDLFYARRNADDGRDIRPGPRRAAFRDLDVDHIGVVGRNEGRRGEKRDAA